METSTRASVECYQFRVDVLNALHVRRSLMCTLGLTNDLIASGQLRAKPRLRKAKPKHILKTVLSPRLATIYQVVGKLDRKP